MVNTEARLLILDQITEAFRQKKKLFAALLDPEKTTNTENAEFLTKLPEFTTHILVGGSTATYEQTKTCIDYLKSHTELPVVLFPGSHNQLVAGADALLFLSLLSGRNADYIIGEQVKAVPFLIENPVEVIPTAYILIDGGTRSSVARVSNTCPMPNKATKKLVHTALAGEYGGKKLIYLEAGSGAAYPVSIRVIEAVCKAVKIPVIVGGGIKTREQADDIYKAGAQMVVVGNALENKIFKGYAHEHSHKSNA